MMAASHAAVYSASPLLALTLVMSLVVASCGTESDTKANLQVSVTEISASRAPIIRRGTTEAAADAKAQIHSKRKVQEIREQHGTKGDTTRLYQATADATAEIAVRRSPIIRRGQPQARARTHRTRNMELVAAEVQGSREPIIRRGETVAASAMEHGLQSAARRERNAVAPEEIDGSGPDLEVDASETEAGPTLRSSSGTDPEKEVVEDELAGEMRKFAKESEMRPSNGTKGADAVETGEEYRSENKSSAFILIIVASSIIVVALVGAGVSYRSALTSAFTKDATMEQPDAIPEAEASEERFVAWQT